MTWLATTLGVSPVDAEQTTLAFLRQLNKQPELITFANERELMEHLSRGR